MFIVRSYHYFRLQEDDLTTLQNIQSCYTGSFLVFSIMFNYVSAVINDPGQPTDSVDEDVETGIQVENIRRGATHGPQCRKCLRPKPERAHHCSICKRCVLKMVKSDVISSMIP